MKRATIIGITGGIGSGKTLVCRILEQLGAPVWYADAEARKLMQYGGPLHKALEALFGPAVYQDRILQRSKIAALVFQQPELLTRLNKIVHPAVQQAWNEWKTRQHFPYLIKEAAIFFESGTAADIDIMVMVSAPEPLRILRTVRRDGLSAEKVKERIKQQLDSSLLEKLCDEVIINNDRFPLLQSCLDLHLRWTTTD